MYACGSEEKEWGRQRQHHDVSTLAAAYD